MHDLSENYFMMIEVKSTEKEKDVIDELTKMADIVRSNLHRRGGYMGIHECNCGETSTSDKFRIADKETNSLIVHYVKNHRSEVPEIEIDKLKNIYELIINGQEAALEEESYRAIVEELRRTRPKI